MKLSPSLCIIFGSHLSHSMADLLQSKRLMENRFCFDFINIALFQEPMAMQRKGLPNPTVLRNLHSFAECGPQECVEGANTESGPPEYLSAIRRRKRVRLAGSIQRAKLSHGENTCHGDAFKNQDVTWQSKQANKTPK